MADGEHDPFLTTRWSVVRAAADGPEDDAGREALAVLYENYARPIYAYVRRRGFGPDDAHDVVHEFYLSLSTRRDLARADPARGRFRAYLLTCLDSFVRNLRRAERAQKRGGGVRQLSLDASAAEALSLELQADLTPERAFERAWARTLLERAMRRLREDYAAGGRAELFDALKPILSEGRGAVPYAELARRLETSPGAVKVAVHKLRQRFGEVLRREVADTVESAADVEEELRALFAAVG